MKKFLKVTDFSRDTVFSILENARKLKSGEIRVKPLSGRSIGLFFEKSSTRTRVSFEVGVAQLGGNVVFLHPSDIQIKRGETVRDTAMVLSRYLDAIVIRAFAHSTLEEWAARSSMPVINGLTDTDHPCQGLTDIFTVLEVMGDFSGKMTYIGDSNNVLNSLMEAAAIVGLDLSVCSPEGYMPDENKLKQVGEIAAKSGAVIEVNPDPRQAVAGADFIYTDVWTSMGQESETEARLKAFKGYQVNEELLRHAGPDAKILHCLPARRGEEITAAVIDGRNSCVFDQAENRLHVQKAILLEIF